MVLCRQRKKATEIESGRVVGCAGIQACQAALPGIPEASQHDSGPHSP